MIRLILVALVAMLSACVSPVKTSSSPPNIKLWQQHIKQVQNIERWDISGRIAIQTHNDGGHADLFWQQTDAQHYDIKLVAPFGSGTIRLQGQGDAVLLTASNGEQMWAQNADDLLQQVEGWRFPVSGLRYWLLGMAAPQSEAKLISWNDQGLLYLMHQDGWRIEMRQYKTVADKILPKKIFIRRLDDDELEVRLIVREWKLDGE